MQEATASNIIGWTNPEETYGVAMPIILPSLQENLNPYKRTYKGPTMSAADLDEECTRIHEANEQYRKYGRV